MLFNFSAKRNVPAQKPQKPFSFTGLPVSGIKVDDETALNYSTFWACVKIISETIAYLPWHVYENGTRSKAYTQHSLDKVLYKRPNSELNGFAFKELMYRQALVQGNFLSEREQNGYGETVNLWPIDWSRVNPDRDSRGRLVYDISNDTGANTVLRPKDVFHVRGPSRDGIVGYSVVAQAKESISMGLAAESFGASFFGNNATPNLVIKNDGQAKLSDEGVIALIKSWTRKHGGSRNSHKPQYLSKGLSVEPVGMPLGDAQFIESRQFQNTEMCRWFRIPPHKVADLLRTTHNNIESQNIEFVTDAILPWVARGEKEADFRLLDSDDNFYTKMNVMGLLRGDSKARAEYYKTLAMLGVLSIDEIRELEDMDELERDGDLRTVPVNMTTLERMKSGNIGPSASKATALVEEVAERFCKFELKKVEKFNAQTSDDEIRNFYVDHARGCADGFYKTASVFADVAGFDCEKIDKKRGEFFSNYCADSADTIKNALVTEKKSAVLSRWGASKPQTLARDLVKYLKEA